jgi:hypothetical protein
MEGKSLGGRCKAKAGEGGFLAVSDTKESTTLMVDDVETCMAILVHKKKGVGALGHLMNTESVDTVVRAIVQMIESVNAIAPDDRTPIDSIIVAGASAHGGGWITRQRPAEMASRLFRANVLSRIRCRFGYDKSTTVSWLMPEENALLGIYSYTAAYYLPYEEQFGLCVESGKEFGASPMFEKKGEIGNHGEIEFHGYC